MARFKHTEIAGKKEKLTFHPTHSVTQRPCAAYVLTQLMQATENNCTDK